MRHFQVTLFLFSLAAFALANKANATQVCLNGGTSSALSVWLTSLQANGEDDEIRLIGGTLVAPVGGFVFNSTEAHSLTISGGWNSTCTTTRDQPDTMIDGVGSQPLMRINNVNGAVEIRRITWSNGYTTEQGAVAAGLQVNSMAGAGTDVIIELNQFLANANAAPASIGGGAVYASTASGHLVLRNNLFVANTGGVGSAAQIVVANAIGYVVSNTVTGNGGAGASNGGIYLIAAGGNQADTFIASNNILWGNVGNDLRIPNNTLLYNNNIEDRLGTANPGSTNNYSVDPVFESISFSSFRLKPGSPMIDAGFNSPFGGLTLVDLDGFVRVKNGIVDIGAYENSDQMFINGFE